VPPAHVGCATALQLAVIQGYLGIVKLLIYEHKANANAQGAKKEGPTALEGAAEHGRLDLVEFLIQSGALDRED
jgi:ankyrin repeat protein